MSSRIKRWAMAIDGGGAVQAVRDVHVSVREKCLLERYKRCESQVAQWQGTVTARGSGKYGGSGRCRGSAALKEQSMFNSTKRYDDSVIYTCKLRTSERTHERDH